MHLRHVLDTKMILQVHDDHRGLKSDGVGKAKARAPHKGCWPHDLGAQTALYPPSTRKSAPVTKLAASLARKTAAAAISAGSPSRLSRCSFPSASLAAFKSP